VKQLKRLNFRWAKHILWIALLAGLFLYLNSSAPFQAIPSESMVPALSRGDLVLIERIAPDQIKVGDIIVYKVPQVFQTKYGYAPKVCHRVIRIDTSQKELSFRTKGDAAGEDPFMVIPQDIVGKDKRSISYLGYLVMFPQSSQGWYFLIGIVILYFLYANSITLLKGARNLRYAFLGVSANEYLNSQREMENKINRMNVHVAQALNAFASSMSDYAKHLASHTSAVKSLAQAAEHLERIIPANQEMVIRKLEVISATPQGAEKASRTESQNNAFSAIEVTPELRIAVKIFIGDYLKTNNLKSLEMTPELRSAVWAFINAWAKTKQDASKPISYNRIP
jgi:signal peptidase I